MAGDFDFKLNRCFVRILVRFENDKEIGAIFIKILAIVQFAKLLFFFVL